MRKLMIGLGLAGAAAVVVAAATGPMPTPAAATDIRVGSLRVTSLADARFVAPNDGKTFGADVGPAAVTQFLSSRKLPTDEIPVSVSVLLVRGIPRHVVLIDTGLGPKAHGRLAASLARAGIAPRQVTDVLITHSHGDHVGGLLDAAGKPAFPNAVVRMADAEWTFVRSQANAKALTSAIAAQVRPFAPGSQVLPGITSVSFPGHTPGHVGYRISSGRASLLDIGDTAHSSVVSLGHPEWAMGFDGDQALGRQTRQAELARLAKGGTLIFSPHFPYPGVGRVIAYDSQYAWKPAVR